jgi:hypothetical protein
MEGQQTRARKPPPLPPAVPGSRRRLRVMFLTTVSLLAITASIVCANLVSDRYRAQVDVTAAGNQRLSPRTQRLMEHLPGRFRVVIAADLRTIDARARERTRDVLSELSTASGNFESQFIDTGSAGGMGDYKRLIATLVSRDQKLIDEQRAAIDLASGAALALSGYLNDKLSPALLEIENGISPGTQAGQTNREYFEQAAAAARVLSKDLTTAGNRANDELKARLDDIAIPATDRAAAVLSGVFVSAVDQLTELSKQLKRFVDASGSPGPAVDLTRPLITAVDEQRDRSSVMLDSLKRLKRLDLLRIVDALRKANAALVIGPPDVGIAAIDLDSLMPSAAWLDATGSGKADLHRRVEELLATSIGSLTNPIKPIVVMVHAEQRAFFDQPEALRMTIAQLVEQMQFRGVDVIEWAVMTQAEPPKLKVLNAEGKRPVVYVSLPPDSSTASPVQGAPTGAQRAAKLGEALTALSRSGKNILLSISPCVLPTYGQPDPAAAVLTRFGLAADSGRPLLREKFTPQRVVDPDQIALAEESTGSLGGAIRGLPMLMPWAVPFYQKSAEGNVRLTQTPLYSLPAGENTWAESQWLRLWQTPQEQRALIPDQPEFNKDRDGRWPEGRPSDKPQNWLLAAAVERSEVGAQPQRLVAVGANYWFFDRVTQPLVSVDGRTAAPHPGNMELFEASVYWLAGQDELIAQSPSAQAFSIIQPIDAKVLSGLRITTILGVPFGVLLLGGLYRLVRG